MAEIQQPVLRFAPSPNGQLHLGHAYSALTNDAIAKRLGGRLLVRIEDIDAPRCPPAFIAGCLQDLAWLGLDWEKPERRQSQHIADYAGPLAELRRRRLLYPCFCSRREIADDVARLEAASHAPWPRDPEGTPLYPGSCREIDPTRAKSLIDAGAPHSWRLDMAAAIEAAGTAPITYRRFDPDDGHTTDIVAEPRRWGDVILARKDVPASYHLAVVVDDALQGVTHVVRGMDLEAATDIHVLLQRLLGLPTPLYHHHPLKRDAAGEKLAKSRGSRSLADLRARGMSASDVRAMLGF